MDKKTELDALRAECLNCEKCPLHETRHNVVFGVGSVYSRIMFIGEGPGEQEDLRGEPFVGRGGQLLDLMLDAVGLSRSGDSAENSIYIANIVKCRPPKNRDPLPDEQDCCIGWLERQKSIIAPEIIVCLGRISAMRIIKPDIRITKEHGLFYKKDGVLMMAMLHPAAVLRNPNLKPEAFADFLRLRDYLAGDLTEDKMNIINL